MATTKIKVRALTKSSLDQDFVVLTNRANRMERFVFLVSPMGTVDAAVVETEIDDLHLDDFKKAIETKEGVTIQNNPAREDVKTDDGTDGDATADDGINEGTRYNWAEEGLLYEVL